MLDRLIAGKQLLRVKPTSTSTPTRIGELRTRLIAFLDAHKTIDAQQWKELTGASREVLDPPRRVLRRPSAHHPPRRRPPTQALGRGKRGREGRRGGRRPRTAPPGPGPTRRDAAEG